MKKLLALLAVVSTVSFAAEPAKVEKAETKKVCVMQKDAKTGKEKEVCKNVKQHKKHEGTKVPDGKK